MLVQLRVGGQAARLLDETVPLRLRADIGQETTGPGGFAKALRTVPVVLDLADEVARRAAPDAWIVDFTNPVGIVTRPCWTRATGRSGCATWRSGSQRRDRRLLRGGAGPGASSTRSGSTA